MKFATYCALVVTVAAQDDDTASDVPVEACEWCYQADEDGSANCFGKVRYGHKETDTWSEEMYTTGDYECTNDTFGDPVPGQSKTCECKEPKEEGAQKIALGFSMIAMATYFM